MVIWGLCGFLAVTLAPAAGLPPELPGMPAGDLVARQIWWVGTIAATAAGIFLIATRARDLGDCAGGRADRPSPHHRRTRTGHPESAVPPGLAATFAANAIAANAIFWSLIGQFLGLALNRTPRTSTPHEHRKRFPPPSSPASSARARPR
jgi:cobalt transporter subunit CbtA